MGLIHQLQKLHIDRYMVEFCFILKRGEYCMDKKMKAVMMYDIGDIRMESIDVPKPKGGEVLIQVKAATTCGTDVKTFVRGYPNLQLPKLFGHGEVAGIVAEIGPDVTEFEVGQRVVPHNSAPCMTCEMCVSHNYMACLNWEKLHRGLRRGAYQEYYLVPEHIAKVNMFEIPDHISFEEAAQLEAFTCAVQGSDISEVKLADTVAIIGSGPQALYHMQVTGLLGATRHIMIDKVDYRLKMAEKIHTNRPGEIYTINADSENVEERVKEITGGIGPDVVIEAAGFPETYAQAIRIVRKLGVVNMYAGAAPGTSINVETGRIHYGGLIIKGTTHTTPYHTHKAFKLIITRGVNVKDIITHKMPLADVLEAFKILTTTKEALKIAINP